MTKLSFLESFLGIVIKKICISENNFNTEEIQRAKRRKIKKLNKKEKKSKSTNCVNSLLV